MDPWGSSPNGYGTRKHPTKQVTFVMDSNPGTYTNVCVADCLFCAFYRRPGDKEGYSLTVDQVMEKIQDAQDKGATTVLLQGRFESALSHWTITPASFGKRAAVFPK